MSRKLRLIRRLERHLRKHPNDKKAREILEALKAGRYEWKGRSLVIRQAAEAQQQS
ncbi:hypothetical protein [Pyrodictium abyssi]|uniref:Uncharacterized protein n=1 Tax=Pyrodictium abyssi TaxID=54256 RepID=A0ABM8IZZ9_9CREN|nr:hypothetical protein PABY_15280 [Pyrodictium abyssi]